MADVASPIAACIVTGVGASCVQAIIAAVWPELSSFGVTVPSLFWGLLGGYAGEMLRRIKAQEDGKPHTRGSLPFLFLSAGIGALSGNWCAKVWFGSSTEAIAGLSAFFGSSWQWLLLALVPAVIEACKTVIARWASK